MGVVHGKIERMGLGQGFRPKGGGSCRRNPLWNPPPPSPVRRLVVEKPVVWVTSVDQLITDDPFSQVVGTDMNDAPWD